ncbi:MAG TPA: hypothetical protein VFB06_04235 [Streptosporangiaceae bacterium]|nr:hypothetical protein [Streptosporangiaceae bacterium]
MPVPGGLPRRLRAGVDFLAPDLECVELFDQAWVFCPAAGQPIVGGQFVAVVQPGHPGAQPGPSGELCARGHDVPLIERARRRLWLLISAAGRRRTADAGQWSAPQRAPGLR